MSRRHIHLDVVGGIAGDMFVAALTDAVPELRQRVLDDVAAVLPAAAGTPW
jgi:pyridinium-3,5-bisthiocarboxylic acid mononucleotide nickel chelatase